MSHKASTLATVGKYRPYIMTRYNKPMKPATIVTFQDFEKLRPTLGTIVCTSGGYDPIHPGHVSCMHDSKQYGDTLVVIVNGDNFLKIKKGKAFMDLKTR